MIGDQGMGVLVTAIDREAGTITVGRGMLEAFDSVLKEYYGPDAIANWREGPHFIGTRTAESSKPGELSPAGMVAVTTFCALEWLRHRKAEVRAAEESGDYTTLIAEFVTWLRALLDSWRGKIGAGHIQPFRERGA